MTDEKKMTTVQTTQPTPLHSSLLPAADCAKRLERRSHTTNARAGDLAFHPRAGRTVPSCRLLRGRLLQSFTRACRSHRLLQCAAVEPAVSQGEAFRFKEDDQNPRGTRLDAFLTKNIPSTTRSKIQAAIEQGNVLVDGTAQKKPNFKVRAGVQVQCTLLPPKLPIVTPQDIPLEVVFEDEHLMVINKPAGMVVHPSAGHWEEGTLVHALLHHLQRPAIDLTDSALLPEAGDSSQDEDLDAGDAAGPGAASRSVEQLLRPGIVHRLDKGTTGLMVAVKQGDDVHLHLSRQFKAHTVHRMYLALAAGCPGQAGEGDVVETGIGRHLIDGKKQAVFPLDSRKGRVATSRWTVEQPLYAGRAALMSWRLQTGRTHQIRVHAKHIGHPLLGDGTYGGTGSSIITRLAGADTARQQQVRRVVEDLGRPALHAKTLGFEHPVTGQPLMFDSDVPPDFAAALAELQTPS